MLTTPHIVKSEHEEYLGLWQTIDDDTNKPRSVVEISLANGTLSGKIVKVFPQPDEPVNPLCEACKGNLHKSEIVGMQILNGMEFEKEKWGGGEILDPNNGKFYDCKIWLEDGKLKVRGYIGFFFRTQEWLREPSNKKSVATPLL
jgi:uncharacterized protein (DUF2147 family)